MEISACAMAVHGERLDRGDHIIILKRVMVFSSANDGDLVDATSSLIKGTSTLFISHELTLDRLAASSHLSSPIAAWCHILLHDFCFLWLSPRSFIHHFSRCHALPHDCPWRHRRRRRRCTCTRCWTRSAQPSSCAHIPLITESRHFLRGWRRRMRHIQHRCRLGK
jgi:hypothetical protein